jgi:PKD repeat protein
VTITVTGGAGPPAVSFTITPSTVAEGQAFTLTWATTNATSVSIGGTAEPLNGSVATSISTAGSYTYTLTAVGPGGTTTKTATVTVTSGTTGGDSVLALQFSKCQGSASPLPGWKNCPGVAKISITQPVSSGWISVFFNYPDDGSFYHGDLQIGSATGTFLVSVINEYESFCPASFNTIVDVYDAPSSSGSGPHLVSQPFVITNHTCN